MTPFIEFILLALTDAQLDRVLVMVSELLVACREGIQTLWGVASPLLIGIIALQLARYQQAALAARKNIVEKIEEESATAKVDREKILTDLGENSRMTREISRNQKTIDALAHASAINDGNEVHTVISLPGDTYEKFDLSSGDEAFWKQEPCTVGKRVRFLVMGAAQMSFHSHEVSEVLTGVKGVLLVEAPDGIHTVWPGETFVSPPGQVHAVKFAAAGEIVADWPDQVGDELKIIIYQK